jgi:hypothetical protein
VESEAPRGQRLAERHRGEDLRRPGARPLEDRPVVVIGDGQERHLGPVQGRREDVAAENGRIER